jgi:hypothetical protein
VSSGGRVGKSRIECTSLLGFGAVCACSIMESEAESIVDRLVGIWSLVLSVERRVAGDRNGRIVAENAFALI